jgi:hypothetical protein
MLSLRHEAHLLLFRNQPALAAELIRNALHAKVPKYAEARIAAADLTDIQPAEYRADLVIQLLDDASVFGIVVEVQLSEDDRKRANPELAVFSAMAHGRDANTQQSVRIAMAAQRASVDLDADRVRLYFDLIISSLSEAARSALKNMDARKYEYQSDFARKYVAQGRVEGATEGRAALIARQLTIRFGALGEKAHGVIAGASIAELDAMGERLLGARTLEEVLQVRPRSGAGAQNPLALAIRHCGEPCGSRDRS